MKKKTLSFLLTFVVLLTASVSAQDNVPHISSNKAKLSSEETAPPVIVVFNELSMVINLAFKEPVKDVQEISVYDIIGNDLFDLQIERIGDKVFLIDAHTLQPGFYFLKIKTLNVEFIQRITVRPGNYSASSKAFIPTFS